MDSKRQLQIGELIKRNFSIVLQLEGRLIYGDVLVSVTNVKMSPDLALAKIYLSIYGTEDKYEVMVLIREQLFRLKQSLAARIKKQVRRIPEIDIFIDDTVDEMYRIDELFARIKDNNSTKQ